MLLFGKMKHGSYIGFEEHWRLILKFLQADDTDNRAHNPRYLNIKLCLFSLKKKADETIIKNRLRKAPFDFYPLYNWLETIYM